jgi:hypothetical protein
VLVIGLGSASCAKRPVVLVDTAFDGKSVREDPTLLILPEKVEVKDVVQDLVANFQGNPESAVQFLRESLVNVLTGKEACTSWGDFSNAGTKLFNLHGSERTALQDSVRSRVQMTRDEYGVTRPGTTEPRALAGLLAANGCRHLIVIDQLTLGRAVSEKGNALMGSMVLGELVLSAQVLVWSAPAETWVYSGYVNASLAGKKVDRAAIEDLSCLLGHDLYRALR